MGHGKKDICQKQAGEGDASSHVARVTRKMDFDYSIEYRYSWYQEYLIFYLILIVSRIVHL